MDSPQRSGARARRAGIPIVHTAHDYHLLCPRAFMLTHDWRICRNRVLAASSIAHGMLPPRVMSICSSVRRAFCSTAPLAGGLPAIPTAIVPNGIPLPNGSADREHRAKFLLLTRLTVEKGVRVVLRRSRHCPVPSTFVW